MHAARALRLRRRMLDLSQQRVIERMNSNGFKWCQTTLSKIESGDRVLTFSEAWFLCHLYEMEVQSLPTETGWSS